MATGTRTDRAIWGGTRVRTTTTYRGIPKGTEGVNLGRREGVPGVMTLLIKLDDGAKVRLPLLALENANKEEYVKDATNWKKMDGPKIWHPHHGDLVQAEERKGEVVYTLRGFSGKWYVRRSVAGTFERTKFYPNLRLARAAYEHIVYDG
jgi:hypothetical protein